MKKSVFRYGDFDRMTESVDARDGEDHLYNPVRLMITGNASSTAKGIRDARNSFTRLIGTLHTAPARYSSAIKKRDPTPMLVRKRKFIRFTNAAWDLSA